MIAATDYQRQDLDFRLQISQPDAGQFVLGTSVLNGSDVLGGSYHWVQYDAEIAELVLQKNSDVTSGIFMIPSANTASVIVRNSSLDPYANAYIHPNAKIKIDYQIIATSTWYNALTGFITQVDVTYNHNAGTLVSFQCEDFMTRLRNTPIASYTHAADTLEVIMNNFMPIAFAASGLDDAVYTPTYKVNAPSNSLYFVANMGAVSYTNTTVGAILDDFMTAELGSLYWVGEDLQIIARNTVGDTYQAFTSDTDNFVGGYSMDYLISTIDASLTSIPGTVLSRTNTDVANYYGYIPASAQVNLVSNDELKVWMNSITQFSPQIRVSEFSMPYFVPMSNDDVINVVNDVSGEASSNINQRFVSSTIYVDATSVRTQMRLWQPV